MFDRFTDRARKVLGLSKQAADEFGHPEIRPEHILLGLVREGAGLGTAALEKMSVCTAELERSLMADMPGEEGVASSPQLPFTPESKDVLMQALNEAGAAKLDFIGTEHLLLGVLHVEASPASQLLRTRGVEADALRQTIRTLLEGTDDALPEV